MNYIIKIGTHWYKKAGKNNPVMSYILHPNFLEATRYATIEHARLAIDEFKQQDAKIYQIIPQEVAVK